MYGVQMINEEKISAGIELLEKEISWLIQKNLMKQKKDKSGDASEFYVIVLKSLINSTRKVRSLLIEQTVPKETIDRMIWEMYQDISE